MSVQNYIGVNDRGLTLSEVYDLVEEMLKDIFTYDPEEPEANPSVYYTKQDIDKLIANYYTGKTTDAHIKSAIDEAIDGIEIPETQEVDLTPYLTKESVQLIDTRSNVSFTQSGNSVSITPPSGRSKVYVEYVANNTLRRDYLDVTRTNPTGQDITYIHDKSFSKDIATVIDRVVPMRVEFKVAVSNVKCYQMSTETSETKMTYSPKYIDTKFADYLTSTETDAHIANAIAEIDIPQQQQQVDLTAYLKISELGTELSALQKNTYTLAGYLTATEINNKINAIPKPNLTPYLKIADLASELSALQKDTYTLAGYVTDSDFRSAYAASNEQLQQDFTTKINGLDTKYYKQIEVDNKFKSYYTKTETENYVTTEIGKIQIPSLDTVNYETQEEPWYTDITSWHIDSNLGKDAYWQYVTYGNGVFVAIAYGKGGGGSAAYSTTGGKTWKLGSGSFPGYWYSLAYGKGRFVALGWNEKNMLAYSDDFGHGQ